MHELDSRDYRDWLESYRRFAATEGRWAAPVRPTAPHHVRDTAASAIWTAFEQVRAYEHTLRWADLSTLHELRIAAKRLRYTIEFVREAAERFGSQCIVVAIDAKKVSDDPKRWEIFTHGGRKPTGLDAVAYACEVVALGAAVQADILVTGNRDVAALLEPLRAEHHLSIVDVSAQRTKVEVYGPNARTVLEHVWEQDLRPAHSGIDACSQGLIAKAPVIMWHCCDGASGCYLLFVRSSFATHVWEVLTDATVEYL